VRELKNVLKRIMILEEPERLAENHFPAHVLSGRNPRAAGRLAAQGLTGLQPLSEVERPGRINRHGGGATSAPTAGRSEASSACCNCSDRFGQKIELHG
jgi:DNA-binding NtrC family response regulator